MRSVSAAKGPGESYDLNSESDFCGDSGGFTPPVMTGGAKSELSIDAFEQLSQIGEGGFGTVFLVRKKSNQKVCAIKAMSKSKYMSADAAQRVVNEFEAMQRVRHPFIMKMLGAFQDPAHFYFILEFVSGGDMYMAVTKHGPVFPESWCQIYTAEIAMALEAIHSHGYMYRDLKLENVLIAHNGHAKLGDFGLAKRVQAARDEKDARDRRNTIIGSLHSLAPEVFTDKAYGSSVDWWALGVLLSELLLETAPLHELPSLSARHLNTLLERYHTNTHILPFARECSQAAEQCIRGLLAVQLRARLTSVAHLKELPFFAGLDWEALFQMRIQAPLATVGLGPRISPQGRRAKPSSADISDAEREPQASNHLASSPPALEMRLEPRKPPTPRPPPSCLPR